MDLDLTNEVMIPKYSHAAKIRWARSVDIPKFIEKLHDLHARLGVALMVQYEDSRDKYILQDQMSSIWQQMNRLEGTLANISS